MTSRRCRPSACRVCTAESSRPKRKPRKQSVRSVRRKPRLQPESRRRACAPQSRLCNDPRADRRRRRRRAGQRRRAAGAERHYQPRHHPAARSDLCRLHPVGVRAQQAAPRLRDRRARAHRARRGQGDASCSTTARSIRSPGKLLFSEAKVDAFTGQVTLRGEFRNPEARAAAGHVCPRPDRAGRRHRRHRRAAAGDPAQRRRRQRGLRRQGRQPRRRAAGAHGCRCRTVSGSSPRA